MSFYLDASVIVPLLVAEPASAAVERFVDSAPSLSISDYAVAETASALSRLIRMRKLGSIDAALALADLDVWRARSATNVAVTGADVRLADVFVRRFELMLRTPDALHIAICHRVQHVLMTLDRRLLAAAGVLGVPTQAPA